MGVIGPAGLAEERHDHHARHIEAGDARRDDRADADEDIDLERRVDDVVLGPEAGERRDPDNGEVGRHEGEPGDHHDLAQRAVAAHVLLVVHPVDHRAGPEEEVGLEDTVRQQVEDREDVSHGAEASREHHVADLAHRRSREGLLDVILGGSDEGAEEHRDDADDHHRREGEDRAVVDRAAADDEVDAGGDHRGRVDERRYRGGALHRVEEPGLERELRGLAAGCEKEQQADPGEGGFTRLACHREDLVEYDGAERNEDQHDRQAQSDVADAVHDEGLLGRSSRTRLVLPEADEQVGRQAHALPADVEQEVVVSEDEQEHGSDEEVEVAEELPLVRIVLHVAE